MTDAAKLQAWLAFEACVALSVLELLLDWLLKSSVLALSFCSLVRDTPANVGHVSCEPWRGLWRHVVSAEKRIACADATWIVATRGNCL